MNHILVWQHAKITRWTLELLDVQPHERLLDVGCGNGVAVKLMAERAVDGFVAGIDYSPVSVDMAIKRNADAIKAKKIAISEEDVLHLPYEERSFDAVCSLESFYFWGDHIAGLKETLRVLKEGGRILIVMELAKDGSNPEKKRKVAESINCPIFSAREVAEMLEAAGFRQPSYDMDPKTEWVYIRAIR